MKKIFISLFVLLFVSCAATKLLPEASKILIVNEKPDENVYVFIGEVVGSEGNYWSGDLTSNEELLIGARNKLRNEAFKLGGDIVYMQSASTTEDNTTIIGYVYKKIVK